MKALTWSCQNQIIMAHTLTYKGNFGELVLSVESDGKAHGTYQEGGELTGVLTGTEFKGTWKNKGLEGLIAFTLSDSALNGNWKKGHEEGPMRGKWEGSLVDGVWPIPEESQASSDEAGSTSEEGAGSGESMEEQVMNYLLNGLNTIKFFQFPIFCNNVVADVGDEALVIKCFYTIKEENLHYNLTPFSYYLTYKLLTQEDEACIAECPNLSEEFVSALEDWAFGVPSMRDHVMRKTTSIYDEPFGTNFGMMSGHLRYVVDDMTQWAELGGPVGLATRLCGCQVFEHVVATHAMDEFATHLMNVYLMTWKELEDLPSDHIEHLDAFLLTHLETLNEQVMAHVDEGILTNALATVMHYHFGVNLNALFLEEPVDQNLPGLQRFGMGLDLAGFTFPFDARRLAEHVKEVLI